MAPLLLGLKSNPLTVEHLGNVLVKIVKKRIKYWKILFQHVTSLCVKCSQLSLRQQNFEAIIENLNCLEFFRLTCHSSLIVKSSA